ncbi:MAG: hypothetical protein KDD82_11065, partial [Planctomycetes bacterium]|nr:hypothetical protein [Planctomycetota bacterium]
MLWIGVARWLELLPYWVGGTGVLLVLLGSGAHRPLWRLLLPEGGAKPKAPPRPTLGIREAGGAVATRPAPVPFAESPDFGAP